MKFSELGLRPELLEGIARLGFETPTPVQAEVIPVLLESDRDVAALAQTGTGKTAAYGLPILEKLELDEAVPQALILCPTRELCMQIARDLQGFSSCLHAVRVLAVYGGADIRPQLVALQRGVHVVIATPGRMLDVLRRKRVDFSKVTRVVLDEADEMLNMGFEEDLEGILSTVPDGAQTLLFSATMPREVAKISHKYMKNPVEITLGTRNAGAENTSHEVYVVQARDRYSALRRIVDMYPRMYGIVFCRTRVETQEIADHLSADGYNAEPLHGDLSQQQRDSVMNKFRKRHVQILVATDVAARGLDVNDLTHVINYTLPDELNSYTHRSGRTGRAGKEGISVSIIHLRERFKIKRLEGMIGKEFSQRSVPTGADISRARLMSLAERVCDTDTGADLVDDHLEGMCALLDGLTKEEIIKRFAAIELHRMLLFYRDAPDLNQYAAPRSQDQRPDRSSRRDGREHPGPRKMTTDLVELVMNAGHRHGLTPQKLMTLVNVADRERSVDIGRINIVRTQAYFEVPRNDAQGVIDAFARSKVDLDGRPISVGLAGAPPATRPPPSGGPKRSPSGPKRTGFGGQDKPRKSGSGR
ncbi:MAG: DEAD/DEAH box helicase [Pseudomonadota bacterium]